MTFAELLEAFDAIVLTLDLKARMKKFVKSARKKKIFIKPAGIRKNSQIIICVRKCDFKLHN